MKLYTIAVVLVILWFMGYRFSGLEWSYSSSFGHCSYTDHI